MMTSKITIVSLLLIVILINLAQTKFTNVPPPPQRPEHFHSKEELKRYLQKVHEYHLIVGRWRLRRDSDDHTFLNTPDDDLFQFFDTNNDHHISENEFLQKLKFENIK